MEFTQDENARSFVLAVQNNSSSDKYFFAAPHTLSPVETSLGVMFECLCNHHVYKIPSHQWWFRIARLKMDKSQYPKNKKVIHVVHDIVEVPEQKALKDYKTILYNRADDPEISR